jgi:hypothetical protein
MYRALMDVWRHGNGANQVTIRNPGNGNIITNMNSSDGYIKGKIDGDEWYELN